jgi:hypothetical protein
MPCHSGQTCDEYEVERKERVAQEAASIQILDETTKICPNTKCGLHIMNISDNYHMTCQFLNLLQILWLIFQGRTCKFEFCWICLAPYKPIRQRGNSFHTAGCKYYKSSLRNTPPSFGIANEAPFNQAYPVFPPLRVNPSTATTPNPPHSLGVPTAIEALIDTTYPVHPPPSTADPSISATTAPGLGSLIAQMFSTESSQILFHASNP